MHREQREQTHALLQQRHIDQAVFAKPESIKWLTGIATPVQVGPNLFEASYPLVWYDGGHFSVILLDSHEALAAPLQQDPNIEIVTYRGYTVDTPIESAKHLLEMFRTLMVNRSANIGIERTFTSALIADELNDGHRKITPIDGWLEPLRMIKTAEELDAMRKCFALTDIGHAAARRATVPGTREIDVWNALHSAIQSAAGCRVPVGNDCVVGYRNPNNIGGWPLDLEIRPQDSVIVDISVVLNGYWSDSCATYYAGERTPKQAKIHQTIQQALELAISLLKPGAAAHEVDQRVRQFIQDAGYPIYPHHTGHAVGVSGHEAPRLTPYNDEVLREGMVILVEPGIYYPGETGVRLEDAVLITSSGPELLTHHDKS